jgi:hypothetical protein
VHAFDLGEQVEPLVGRRLAPEGLAEPMHVAVERQVEAAVPPQFGLSSLTTTARPARTGSPASTPPVFRRDSSTASRVNLPDFHRLVNRVTAPGRK